MSSLGSYLRDLRQRRGQSLEEVSRVTRVATSYLEALEADDFAELPSPVFTRGYIRAYCQVLGETPDEALLIYRRQTGAPAEAPTRPGGTGSDSSGRGRGTMLVSFILLVVLGLALFAVTLALQSGRDKQEAQRAESQPIDAAAPLPPEPSGEPGPLERNLVPPAAALGPTVSPPVGSLPENAAARPTPPAVLSANEIHAAVGAVMSPYQLVARVSEPTWIRVRTEDGRVTEETVAAGQTRVWVSNTPFVLTIGNAGGVTLEVNGRPLPPLGARGAVIPRLVLPPSGP